MANVLNIWSTLYPIQSVSATLHYLITYKIDRLIIHTLIRGLCRCVFEVVFLYSAERDFFFFILFSTSTILTFTLFDQDFSSTNPFWATTKYRSEEREREKHTPFAFILIFSSELFFSCVNFRPIFSRVFFTTFFSLSSRNECELVMILICGCVLRVLRFRFLWALAQHH